MKGDSDIEFCREKGFKDLKSKGFLKPWAFPFCFKPVLDSNIYLKE